ncbi:TPA: hypothetical protein ACWLUJ_006579 [Pseudomonas aeruginosa]|nr:hypothetical protein [Pseudomonas aeruginosa]EIU2862453.1 hypothetical protein [Pseudomonas aeruginosa]MBH4415215.1 hypothetical protein [Pseudomonas aeruginosa]HEK3717127.1 hypothetical protein [Pseudomonas aeruginosa]
MKTYPRLVALLRTTMNLTTGEAEALMRGAEAEAVVRCGGKAKVIARAMALRHYYVTAVLLRKYPNGVDKTMYCIDLGYAGRRRVILSDGKVVSHGRQDWHQFAERLRTKARAAKAA